MKEDSRKESLSLSRSLACSLVPLESGKRGLTRDKGSLALSRVSVPVFAVVSRQPRLLFDACHSSDHTSDERPAATLAAPVEGNECHGVCVRVSCEESGFGISFRSHACVGVALLILLLITRLSSCHRETRSASVVSQRGFLGFNLKSANVCVCESRDTRSLRRGIRFPIPVVASCLWLSLSRECL